ncbi:MAG TPA: helix-turn-helix domain-containing protein, partial [Edaphobacter sp.]|nr:helix-turn-helix domain-containing protein [Edaphobacter sp.]
AFLNQVSQSAACNRLHPVEQRLCRWILMSHDRSDGDRIALTQEFLAQMLGVQRSTLTVAAGELQRTGSIEYSRGKITISNRPLLKKAACECYEIVDDAYRRLIKRGADGNIYYV